MNKTSLLKKIFLYFFALLTIFPFIAMIIISFRPHGLIYEGIFAPIPPIFDNYKVVFSDENFLNWYSNTVLTVLITIIIRLGVTLPAAYAFSRMKVPFRTAFILLFGSAYMIPPEATMVPRYLFFKNIHLLDNIFVIILPEISEVFYLVLIMEFFKSIPKEYEEAAFMDGATTEKILTKIFVPLSKPIIATTVLFSFINIWNNFLDPYLFIKTQSRQLITPALQYFANRGGVNIPVQLAGATIAIVPIIILFIFSQKYFISGVNSSGIKG
jgi:multiple sugar transport system permease protein